MWPLLVVVAFAVAWILLGRESAEAQLNRMGDMEGTDRLIEAEQRRDPRLTRDQAAKKILRELRRDSS